MSRRPLVIGNWKMNLTERWARDLLDHLLPRLEDATAVETATPQKARQPPVIPCITGGPRASPSRT